MKEIAGLIRQLLSLIQSKLFKQGPFESIEPITELLCQISDSMFINYSIHTLLLLIIYYITLLVNQGFNPGYTLFEIIQLLTSSSHSEEYPNLFYFIRKISLSVEVTLDNLLTGPQLKYNKSLHSFQDNPDVISYYKSELESHVATLTNQVRSSKSILSSNYSINQSIFIHILEYILLHHNISKSSVHDTMRPLLLVQQHWVKHHLPTLLFIFSLLTNKQGAYFLVACDYQFIKPYTLGSSPVCIFHDSNQNSRNSLIEVIELLQDILHLNWKEEFPSILTPFIQKANSILIKYSNTTCLDFLGINTYTNYSISTKVTLIKDILNKPNDMVMNNKPNDMVMDNKLSDMVMDNKPSDMVMDNKPSDMVMDNKPSDMVMDNKPNDMVMDNKPNDMVMNNKPNDMVMDNKPNDMVMDNKLNDMVMDNKPNDMVMDNKPNDMVMDNKLNDMVMDNKPNDMVMNNKPNDMVMDNKPNDMVMDNKLNDMVMDNKLNDMVMDNKPNDMVMDNTLSDMVMDNKPNDMVMDNKLNDMVMDNKPNDMVMNNKPNDMVMDNKPNDMVMDNKLNDMVMDNKPNDMVMDNTLSDMVMNLPSMEEIDERIRISKGINYELAHFNKIIAKHLSYNDEINLNIENLLSIHHHIYEVLK